MDPLTMSIVVLSFNVGSYYAFVTIFDIVDWVRGQLLEGKMPRATVSKDTERFELETLPGAFVELRRLSYGEKLRKDAEASKMRFATAGDSKGGIDAEVAMINVAVQQREFALCIVNHNLTKANPKDPSLDVPLVFANPA